MSQYAYDPYMTARQTNGLGVAGFVCSLVGLLLTGGLLCPIGVILSLIALGRQPRGFAVAGLILGLLGTCGGLAIALLFGAALIAAVLGVAAFMAFSEPEKLEITSDMIKIAIGVEEYQEKNKYLPAGIELLGLEESTLNDPWGQKYQYVQGGPQNDFDLISAGKDKIFDTVDDVRLTQIDKLWQFSESVHVSGGSGAGAVKIDLGEHSLDVEGTESDGTVKLNVGGRVIEVSGDKEGESGTVDVDPATDDLTEPSQPTVPPATPPATPPSTPPAPPPTTP